MFTQGTTDDSPHGRELRRAYLTKLRESVFDCDIALDDARDSLLRALDDLRAALQRRDDVVRQLAEAIASFEAAA
jgi:hypothetical protein